MLLLNTLHEGGFNEFKTQVVSIVNRNMFDNYLHSMAVASQEFLKTKF